MARVFFSAAPKKLFYCITRDLRLAINLVLEYLLATRWPQLNGRASLTFSNCKHFMPQKFFTRFTLFTLFNRDSPWLRHFAALQNAFYLILFCCFSLIFSGFFFFAIFLLGLSSDNEANQLFSSKGGQDLRAVAGWIHKNYDTKAAAGKSIYCI